MLELGSKVKNILIVTSDYYEDISKGLIKGSTDFIKHQNITHEKLKINKIWFGDKLYIIFKY